jgi:hypothetical protein
MIQVIRTELPPKKTNKKNTKANSKPIHGRSTKLKGKKNSSQSELTCQIHNLDYEIGITL